MESATPLKKRPFDLVLVIIFGMFAMSSFFVDLAAGLNVSHDSPFGQTLASYGEMADPLVLQNPLWLQLASLISGVVFGPFYVALVYALIRERAWIRKPALIYVGAMVYSMVLYYGVELLGPTPPTSYPIMVGSTLPYLLAPAALCWRMWRDQPFDR